MADPEHPHQAHHARVARVATGIDGLDAVLRGGIPEGRVTLVSGPTGTGKSVFVLHALARALRDGESVVLVAFEEDRARIAAAAAAFGIDLAQLEADGLQIVDARPDLDAVFSGSFDLGGLLAVVGQHLRISGARRVAFDAIDVVLAHLSTDAEVRRELARLHAWLLEHGVTALLTVREDPVGIVARSALQYLVDCAIELERRTVDGVGERTLRVVKVRGSGFAEGDHPYTVDDAGVSVGFVAADALDAHVASSERVGSGVARLDAMLGGGYFRASGVLVTGAPGTAKTTLAGAFAAAASARGEPTLLVSYDSYAGELVRNLASVGIDLEPYRRSGVLRLMSERAVGGSSEAHLSAILRAAERHGVQNLVVDPLSAIGKRGSEGLARGVVERIVAWAKLRGVTMLCTSLQADSDGADERTEIAASTIADTWLHLSYVIHAGERNRALTIVKSRGTAHSNQVRELVLSDRGVDLRDVYVEGGAVLMGTLRSEREQATLVRRAAERDALERDLGALAARERAVRARLDEASRDLADVSDERERLTRRFRTAGARETAERSAVHTLRGGDAAQAEGVDDGR